MGRDLQHIDFHKEQYRTATYIVASTPFGYHLHTPVTGTLKYEPAFLMHEPLYQEGRTRWLHYVNTRGKYDVYVFPHNFNPHVLNPILTNITKIQDTFKRHDIFSDLKHLNDTLVAYCELKKTHIAHRKLSWSREDVEATLFMRRAIQEAKTQLQKKFEWIRSTSIPRYAGSQAQE
jgi:hypothetical protein